MYGYFIDTTVKSDCSYLSQLNLTENKLSDILRRRNKILKRRSV